MRWDKAAVDLRNGAIVPYGREGAGREGNAAQKDCFGPAVRHARPRHPVITGRRAVRLGGQRGSRGQPVPTGIARSTIQSARNRSWGVPVVIMVVEDY